jgi:hypothetical protein
VRRGTLITIIALAVLLIVAAVFQLLAGRGPRRYPGPGFTSTPTALVTGAGAVPGTPAGSG